MEFLNKTVLISGGASGIGLLAGKCFAEQGANVVLADINGEALDAAVAEVRAISEKVIGVRTDVTDYEQVVACRDKAVAAFGTIDVLIPCAGGAETRMKGLKGDFFEFPISALEFSIKMNLMGALYFDHAVMQVMAKQGSGVIIHIGSVTGEEGCPSNLGYSASKSALMTGALKSVAIAGAKFGVRVCCVVPGPVMTRAGMARMMTLMDYPAETQEIVDMLLYLASDKARSITGTTIFVDGGRSIMHNKGFKLKEETKA